MASITLNIATKIVVGLFLGCLITIFFAQYDPWIQEQSAAFIIRHTQKALGCTLHGTIKSINLFDPAIEFKDMQAVAIDPSKEDWRWSCASYKTGFSWWRLFLYGTVDLWITIDQLSIESAIENRTLAIEQHLKKIFLSDQSAVSLLIKSIVAHKISATLFDRNKGWEMFVRGNFFAHRLKNSLKSMLFFTDGAMHYDNFCYLKLANGTIKSTVEFKAGVAQSQSELELAIDSACFDENRCYLSGSYADQRAQLCLKTLNNNLIFDPIVIEHNDNQWQIDLKGKLPFAWIWNLVYKKTGKKSPISATASVEVKGPLSGDSLEGLIVLDSLCYGDYITNGSCRLQAMHNKVGVISKFDITVPQYGEFSGSSSWHYAPEQGTLKLTNSSQTNIPYLTYWKLIPHALHAEIAWDKQGLLRGNYWYGATHQLLKTKSKGRGVFVRDGKRMKIGGFIGDNRYRINGNPAKPLYLESARYIDAKKNTLIEIASDKTGKSALVGSMQIPFARSLVQALFDYDLQGEGLFRFTIDNKAPLTLHLNLENGIVRLPQTYNFIDRLHADFIYQKRANCLIINDLFCGLHAGSIMAKTASLYLDDKGAIRFAHIPLLLDSCLFNSNKDLFAMLSGAIALVKKENKPWKVRGDIFFDESQLKENIFAQELQKKIMQSEALFFIKKSDAIQSSLHISSKQPIRIDTPFLEANAGIDIHVKKNLFDPKITGKIVVQSGMLKFPYKPLHVTQAAITFSPQQSSNDPAIELIAKNSIRQNNVTLHVTGSLKDHHIILESTPPLTQEQIIALLVTGSPQDSVGAMMPTLMVQNLTQMIFGSGQESLWERYFNRTGKQFNIHFIPSFTDQTGRGGLRGALEIDVNNRCRALIQQNFSLTEDTKFELEYLLSDDVTIRAIRDERKDIGTEVEMRWKL